MVKHLSNLFVHFGVIFHGARPQRVEPTVHTVVPLREAGKVADDIYFAQLWKTFQLSSHQVRRDEILWLRLFDIPSGKGISFSAFSSLLEDEKFVLNQTSISYLLHVLPLKIMGGPISE
jgi:hypothetical protein